MPNKQKVDAQHKARMRRGRMGGPSLWEKKKQPPPQTSFLDINQDLRCMKCDRIFNGPHFGETVKNPSKRYSIINQEDLVAANYDTKGGISDGVCSRRSCIDAARADHMQWVAKAHPDQDLTAYEESYKQSDYDEARKDSDRYPEGFLDE